jgi:hypothetical protein
MQRISVWFFAENKAPFGSSLSFFSMTNHALTVIQRETAVVRPTNLVLPHARHFELLFAACRLLPILPRTVMMS